MLASKKNFFVSIIIITIIWSISFFLLFQSNQKWGRIAVDELEVLNNIKEVRLNVSSAHLKLEEMITGGEKVESERIFKILETATGRVRRAMYYESTSINIDYDLVKELDRLKILSVEFEEMARHRWINIDSAGIGTPLDKLFDTKYKEIISESLVVEAAITKHIEESRLKQQKLFNGSIIGLIIIIVLSVVVLIFINNRLVKSEVDLIRANTDIESANEQIAAFNKELVAANEKLGTANEKMIAANVELEATNEELDAANVELNAANEELNATNEELDATNADLNDEIAKRDKVEDDLTNTQNVLIKERNKVEAILASIGDGISIQDRNFTIIYVNDFYKQVIGPDLIGKKCYKMYEKRDAVCDGCPIKETFETGKIARSTRSGYDKDGNEIHVDVTASPIRDETGEIIAGIELAKNVTEQMASTKEREKLIAELKEALAKLNTLSKLIPICSSCKSIRDDKGYWNQIEMYISKHTDSLFTHGLCPECTKKLYPDLGEEFYGNTFDKKEK